jgi:tRNA(fMet)-specific endonuclease VapC
MSSLRYLLDTNICIYIARQRPPSVAARFAKLASGSVGMSLITFGELRYGAEKSQQRVQALDSLNRLSSLIPVMTPGATVGERYGAIRAQLERAGTPIGNNDLWIAAHALDLGVTLISNNLREFERVPKLKLDNWID